MTAVPQPASFSLSIREAGPIGERLFGYSALGLAISLAGFAGWTALSLPGLIDPNGKPLGYDFMAFWSAARLALDGRPALVFDWAAIEAMHRSAVPGLSGMLFPWHYPPTFLLVVVPLGLLGYPAALAMFLLSTAALWAGLLRRIAADPRAWVVIAAMPAGLVNLLDGQNGFLTTGLAGFALLLLDRRPLLAGMLIGLLAIKPHLALLFPLALAAAGHWRAFAGAAATVILLVAASLAAFGWETMAAFFDYMPRLPDITDHGWVPWSLMPSPYVTALSLGLPVVAASLLQAAVAAGAALCVWRAWRRDDAPFAAKAAVLFTASLLISPYLFYYDLMWAGLAVVFLFGLAAEAGFRRGERPILLAAWLAPLLMPPVHWLTHIQLGCPLLILLLWAASRRVTATAAR
jgi:hypothetical protein